MTEPTDLRADRDRIAQLADAIDRSPYGQSEGATLLVVKTVQETTYPAIAASTFACQVQTPGGPETEGALGSLVATTAALYAFNLGSALPPQGTLLLATQVGDRWVIHYDG